MLVLVLMFGQVLEGTMERCEQVPRALRVSGRAGDERAHVRSVRKAAAGFGSRGALSFLCRNYLDPWGDVFGLVDYLGTNARDKVELVWKFWPGAFFSSVSGSYG